MNLIRRIIVLCFCVQAGLVFSGCLKIEVDRELIPHIPAIPDPDPGAPVVHLWIHGERMDESDWAKALTISRFFFSGVENVTGSPRELLEPAVREVLRQRGYRTAPEVLEASQTLSDLQRATIENDLIFELFGERNQLLWLPPREFIQTPRARARGTVRVDLLYRSRLIRLIAAADDGLPDSQEIVWEGEFVENQELRVLPGEEKSGLSQGAAGSFQNYLYRLQIDLPRPARQ